MLWNGPGDLVRGPGRFRVAKKAVTAAAWPL
jgi:hypothetical protein